MEAGVEDEEFEGEMTINHEIPEDDLIRTMEPEQIERLIPQRKFDQLLVDYPSITADTCTICIDYLKNDLPLRCVPLCKHIFHAECLLSWLMVNEICPNCKNEISIYTLRAYYESMKQSRKDKTKEKKEEPPKLRNESPGKPAIVQPQTEVFHTRLNRNQSIGGRSSVAHEPRVSRIAVEDGNRRNENVQEYNLESVNLEKSNPQRQNSNMSSKD